MPKYNFVKMDYIKQVFEGKRKVNYNFLHNNIYYNIKAFKFK